MADVVEVRCATEFDPPEVQVTIAGLLPFQVSTGVYEYLRQQLGWPENPCAGLGD